MSNTSFDASGALLFDGPARVTPVIQMLFRPFHVNAKDSGHNHRCTIDVFNNSVGLHWDRYLEQIVDSVQGRTSQIPTTEIFTVLGRRYGVALQAFAESIKLDEWVQLADIVRLALLLRDGHNLVGYCLQGARHSDATRIGTFGGWASYQDSRCAIHLSTDDILDFAERLTEALEAGASAPAQLIDDTLTQLVHAIQDSSQRRALKLRYALPIVDHEKQDSSSPAWERTVYLSARATDDGDGPLWARLCVTPAFVGRLQRLRGLCLAQDLRQLQVAECPLRWGPDSTGYCLPLSNGRLVVTPTAFFYSASPGRRSYSIETEPLAIDWFVATLCGPGKPLHVRVSANLVRDET